MVVFNEKCKKCCSLLGAHLALAPLSFLWIYGNLSAYMDSYFMFACRSRCLDGDSQWILCLFVAGQVPGTFLAKPLVKRFGMKWTGMVALTIGNLALLCSAWSLQFSVAGTAAMVGILSGTCLGISCTVAIQLISGWAPKWAGVLTATATSFATMLSVLQNQIITAYVNPNNLKADAIEGPKTYFSQPQILARVPGAVIIIAVMSFGLQLIAYMLVSEPPQTNQGIRGNISSQEKCSRGDVSEYCVGKIESSNNLDRETCKGVNSYGSNDVSSKSTTDVRQETYNQRSPEEGGMSSEVTPISWKPSEVLQSPTFYAVFFFSMALDYGLLLKANFYKQFGLIYINNDQYLTLIGTLVPVISTCSRIVFGTLLDKGILSIKDIVVFGLSANGILCFFWYLAPQWNMILYSILILGMAVAQSLFYVIMPTAALRLFGPDHVSTNFGLNMSAIFIISILVSAVISPLLHALGWFWLFASCSIFNLLTLCFVVATNFNTQLVTKP